MIKYRFMKLKMLIEAAMGFNELRILLAKKVICILPCSTLPNYKNHFF